jgi:regulatory protein
MTITEITETPGSKCRYRIFIDEEFAFVLYKGELRSYGISIGNELSAEAYHEIIEKTLPKRAKKRALHLLKSRRYTEKQMRDKLAGGDYSIPVINQTIAYLQQYGYIDDSQYARDYIDYHINRKSCRRIGFDLLNKGIPNEITSVIYSEAAGADSEELENTLIRKWLEKKKYAKDSADLKEKQRVFAFLARKGFPADSIRRFI